MPKTNPKGAHAELVKERETAFCRLVALVYPANASQAAREAGFPAKNAKSYAYNLLQRPDIRAEIQRLQAERAERTMITGDMVLEELARIGFADMREFATWGASGVRLKESSEMPDGAARCVAELSQTLTQHGGSIRFKLHDKVAALTLLGKHLRLFGDVDEPPETEEERARRIRAQLDAMDEATAA
jgi:phage terminase small subunit